MVPVIVTVENGKAALGEMAVMTGVGNVVLELTETLSKVAVARTEGLSLTTNPMYTFCAMEMVWLVAT